MIVTSRVVRGVLQIGVAAAALSVLASCSTVTYGTGVGTTAQTFQDLTGPLNFLHLGGQQTIDYAEPRPAELNTNVDPNNPPPPVAPTDTGETTTPAPIMTPNNTACGGGTGDPAPPDADCVPNPNAPAVVQQTGGLFNGTVADNGIRQLVNPCQWTLVNWEQMNRFEQQALGRLGWSASNWGTTDPSLLPDTINKSWNDLSFRERRAADSLGFDETSWNACTVL